MPKAPSAAKRKRGTKSVKGFLLHVYHRDQRNRAVLYAIGRLETGETFGLVDDRLPPAFYVRASDAAATRDHAAPMAISVEESSWSTMDGEPVARVTSGKTAPLRRLGTVLENKGIRTYEADVSHSRRYLIDHGLKGAVRILGAHQPGTGVDRVYINPELNPVEWEPSLTVLALDIETNRDATQVYAVSLVGFGGGTKQHVEEIHIVGDPAGNDPSELTCHPTEKQLLVGLAERIRTIDPDILTGWNVIDFDLPVLRRRFQAHGIEFNFGRTREESWYREGQSWGRSGVVVYGRQVLDALHLVRATLQRYQDFRLDTVARAILGRGKTLEADEDRAMPDVIARAYREDRPAFCTYCIEDSRLVRDILEAEGLIELSLRRSLLTGLPLDRAWGSVAAFEFLYMTELHRRKIVAPTSGIDRPEKIDAPGGLVMSPESGLYRNVFVFDFKSLYPSIICTFNIDPLAHARAQQSGKTERLVRAPNGAAFDREPGILPGILEQFFASRDRAKKDGDAPASFAYKIVMNSFYGVLATDACRFASGRLAGAITEFGHYILRWARGLLEREDLRVLYGDTDSLFVDSGLEKDTSSKALHAWGEDLCDRVNEALATHVKDAFGVESRLELEFEKVYRRFLLPPTRGNAERARSKGYAGLRVGADGEVLEIVGMEAARRDWTDLAHNLQRELLHRLFRDESPEDIERCITRWVRELRAGASDKDLVYHKGLRKPVSSYTRTTPPHVKAAKLLPNPSGVIHYVMTVAGPQPVGRVSASLDYNHYVLKQIRPIVQTIAQVCPIDVRAAVQGERSLFGNPPGT